MSEPEYWHCESCNAKITPETAQTETVPGARGHTITLAYCEDCANV